jgi:hypothetical protein
MNTLRWRPAAAGLLLMAVAALVPGVFAGEAAPNFAGTWRMLPSNKGPATPPPNPNAVGPPPMVLAALPLLRPDVAARVRTAAPPTDRGYCAPPRFTGAVGYSMLVNARIPIAFEILASPDRLTMLDEAGLIRRLYLRDTPLPNWLDETNAGNSLARFEGATLVVRTSALNPETQTIRGVPGSILGHNAQVLERMRLVENGEMEIVATVTAPELYAAPVTTTNRYRRDPGRTLLELTFCSETDRSYNADSRSERFDATPPPDLPPPPSN